MLVTIKALAERKGVTANQIRSWIRDHGLPTIRIGKRILIQLESFDEWLKSLEQVEVKAREFVVPRSEENYSLIAKKMRRIY